MNTITASSLSDLKHVAHTILCDMKGHNIFAINGAMGAGKTTIIKEFCSELGVTEIVSSPTFALINEYSNGDNDPVYHFDFYRIKKIDEVFDIGYEEYFYSDYYCFVEWPELVLELLPQSYVYVLIEEKENGIRVINYSLVSH
ncbi:MAG: tRNA (adenosine(37)-N6)-threonylcarbamoyltransferase complex ATPase subunit type 1 TsaE [Bacteroidetes bacterium]|nr:tRNA (adenosine(37)-N6)-threonylcarbamoyltransferase complex ATPase subunit type 1 TsaE [Bacteroidota bacterium]